MSTLTLTVVQATLAWHDPDHNRDSLARRIDAIDGDTDVIVLPEMFTTGFTMASDQVAEDWPGPTLAWMQDIAASRGAAICGSISCRVAEGDHRNRFLWVEPGAEPLFYDKRHLFRMSGEHEHYRAGGPAPAITWRGFRIRPVVCYDLRFPVWIRGVDEYDLLVCVANWPAPRREHWLTLARARAIENQAFVAAANRVGVDGNGVEYSGDSRIYDGRGRELAAADGEDTLLTATLELDKLREWRAAFPAWQDADRFTLST